MENNQIHRKNSFLSNAVLIFMVVFIVAFLLFILFLYNTFRSSVGNLSTQTIAKNLSAENNAPKTLNSSLNNSQYGATTDDPSIGPKGAPITLVEFSDFQCPFCLRAYPIIKKILKAYPNKIYFIYRDFPVSDSHEFAQIAAEAGECAHDQGKFWELHDRIFENQKKLNEQNLYTWASELGLNMATFRECLESRKYKSEVEEDFNEGAQLGVLGTPTFFLNGQRIPGVIPFDTFIKIIEEELKGNL